MYCAKKLQMSSKKVSFKQGFVCVRKRCRWNTF